ncbi:MAG TPA: LacI family DNA-binding transcriptional regulator [Chitinophagaceae bacterium]|nr:LacI family DNA-binding transcriptional regulator [Chitinophagaceae bacterium]
MLNGLLFRSGVYVLQISNCTMKLDQITIKDIAKALNLSIATVSRALRDSYKISQVTKQKVLDYATAHNYRPNLMAQSLKNKKSRTIGVIISSVPNNFFAEVINGIESVASQKDYHVIITQSQESREKEIKNTEHLAWKSVDGLLVSLSTETEDVNHFKKLHEFGLPFVFFDRITNDIKTHLVVVDNCGGAKKATQHFIEGGYKRIAHITSSANTSITKERLEGYYQALQLNNIPIEENYIKYCQHGGMNKEEIENAIDELFALDNPPDALLAASDRLTIGSFSILKKRNISIPDTIALAGFCNFSSPELFYPSLTTIRQPALEMGKAAAELLIELIEAKRPVSTFKKIELPIELQVRNSSLSRREHGIC